MDREYRERGLAVVSVSVDQPEDAAVVREFLQSQGAVFDNLISRHGASTRTGQEFGFDGGVPLYQLFDRSGRLAYQFRPPPFYTALEKGEPLDRLEARVGELLSGG